MSTRIEACFEQLRAAGRKAFVPFITAGDPDLEFTREALLGLSQAGADVCEVGIPYSDPIADGPVIQASYVRALDRGTRLSDIFEMLRRTTPEMTAPVALMVSYAIVLRYGLPSFVADARGAGVAGFIVPDLLVEESAEFAELCGEHQLSLIPLVTPTTPRDRALQIAQTCTGFLYYVSITGITGARSSLRAELAEEVAWLRERVDAPICVGFGISRPEHVQQLAPIADGVIVGSALVRKLEDVQPQHRDQALQSLLSTARELIDAGRAT